MDIASDVVALLMFCALFYSCKSFFQKNPKFEHGSGNKRYRTRPFIIKYFGVFFALIYLFIILLKITMNL